MKKNKPIGSGPARPKKKPKSMAPLVKKAAPLARSMMHRARPGEQVYDNEAVGRDARVANAKRKVGELVREGYRLNPSNASDTYHSAVKRHGTQQEKRVSERAQRRNAFVNKWGR